MDYDRLRELQEKFEENPRRYFAPLANEYRKGGQPKRAIEICRAQLAQMPGHMSGQIVFGQALYEAGEFDEARQVFERALSLDPENLIALRTLGDMSLQSGDTQQARKWYTRLLDADPKDTAVIALVSEIDASAAAVTPVPEEIPGVDTDAGDQPIPFITDVEGEAVGPEPAIASSDAPPATDTAAPAPAPAVHVPPAAPPLGSTIGRTTVAPPPPPPSSAPSEIGAVEGLERHYPTEPETPPDVQEAPIEEDYGVGLGSEGLTSSLPTPHTGLTGAYARIQTPEATEGLQGSAAEPEPTGTEGLQGRPVPQPLAGARGSRSDDEEALDTWTPPPGAHVHERVESRKEDRMFSGPSTEPFVNETMAQLYLQQGYRQLALKVYYQLAASRPDDQGLKDKIAEIEAADRAAHPEAPTAPRAPEPVLSRAPEAPVQRTREPVAPPAPEPVAPRAPEPVAPRASEPIVARGTEPSIERPTAPPAPRAPSIESPTPSRAPESEEGPSFDRSPVDSPPTSQPTRERESIESPVREEPQAEPEGIAARQPSVREFFATLGRRRPPRSMSAGTRGGGGGTSHGGNASVNASSNPAMSAGAASSASAPMNATPTPAVDAGAVMGGAAPSASLDAVFAGAQVNPADSRAASRLAGAFSGTPGARTTPPTPPMPTPRVNPRLPQAQESEEDVAKFRAWLDGLTGE
ncbi:MAG TPA: tetratricopeptide repeat protein [Gemmatimonadaceae bacterium]|nr:tetratricopeptide repeat protein [Gemmatimonadaceae bacterium]